jgi:hypothetical protein
MEVLISVFILSIGLLGVAALIPVGKLAMKETEASDRTGALGRAALHDLKVRGLLNLTWIPGYTYQPNTLVMPRSPNGYAYICTTAGTSSATTEPTWSNAVIEGSTVTDGTVTWTWAGSVFAIDPRGSIANPGTNYLSVNTSGTIDLYRGNLAATSAATPTVAAALADAIFRSQDDLMFSRPEEIIKTATVTPPPAGTRPVPSGGTLTSEGNASWFLTVGIDPLQPTLFNVSVVVCYKRDVSNNGADAALHNVTALSYGSGTGGAVIQVPGKWPANWALKNDDWVFLIDDSGVAPSAPIVQATWYRVVGAGYDGSTYTNITLVGPDWISPNTSNLTVVHVRGTTGVYTETVQLN